MAIKNKIYDLAIIGGGPAGLMAASVAAQKCEVIILEKNSSPGVKLLMTGNGRSNITNFIENPKELIKKYGKEGKFLFSAFFNFSATDTIDFFNNLGIVTKVESGNKVFPVTDKSRDVLNALLENVYKKGADIKTNCSVRSLLKNKGVIEKIILDDGQEIFARNFLIATGGLSYPASGSSGDGYAWAKELGHTITDLHPALTPVYLEEKFIKAIEGTSLNNVKIKLYKNKKFVCEIIGDAIFTADGISGPAILNLSLCIDKDSSAMLSIDFQPDMDELSLEKTILLEFNKINNKKIGNCLDFLLPKKIGKLILELSGLDVDKQVNAMKKDERKILLKIIKDFRLNVKSTYGFERAMLTRGGISLEEVDPKTMRSKIIPNLYFAGEVLDLQGPTGGFNLQIAWSTGFAAGKSIAEILYNEYGNSKT